MAPLLYSSVHVVGLCYHDRELNGSHGLFVVLYLRGHLEPTTDGELEGF